VACVGVLGCFLTHIRLIVIIRLSVSAILVRLHHEVASSGTRYSGCKPVVLVTHEGCHLLDSLVACGTIEARNKIVRGSREGLCSPCEDREEQL
jgi:hypothetical protein